MVEVVVESGVRGSWATSEGRERLEDVFCQSSGMMGKALLKRDRATGTGAYRSTLRETECGSLTVSEGG